MWFGNAPDLTQETNLIQVGVLPNQCNSSLVVHNESRSFVDAQAECGNSFARLPLRTSKVCCLSGLFLPEARNVSLALRK